jgi:hypothetical protein
VAFLKMQLRPLAARLSSGVCTFRVSSSVYQVPKTAAKAQLLTPPICNSRLHPKEPRNSLVQRYPPPTNRWVFCTCSQVQADVIPASGGRLIQHPQGE